MNKRIFLKVKAYIEKYHMIAPQDTVVAGVSGGADSVCLLLMLHALVGELPFRLLAVHVDHGIREEAGEDAAYVEKLCGELSVPFFLIKEDVRGRAKRDRLSEEEAGRNVRYEAFEKVLSAEANGQGKIAVAHNANDRVETMLFHLFRGTGLAGMSGIRPVRGKVIRPLLALQRSEIEEYLGEKQVSYCIDRTNLEDTYTRNRIRNHIFPYAESKICHNAATHMWEAADLLLETEEYIRERTKEAFAECLEKEEREGIALKASVLAQKEPFMQKQVLLYCLERLMEGRKDITSAHITAIRELLAKPGSRETSLPGALTARREYDRLWIGREAAGKAAAGKRRQGAAEEAQEEAAGVGGREIGVEGIPGSVAVPGLGEVEFSLFSWEKTEIIPEKSYTKWFDYDKITKSAVFRTRRTGDYLTVDRALSRKSLKKYMIDEKIPREIREDLYVLADGSHILWVPGYRISQYYKVSENTKRILQVRIRGGL